MLRPTTEQRRLYYEHASKWWSIGRCTRPADRQRTEAAIARLYRQAQLEAPRVIWLPCALSAALSAVLYRAFRYPGARCGPKAPQALWNAIEQQLSLAKRAVTDTFIPNGQSLKTPVYETVGYVLGCAMNYSLHNVPYSGVDTVVHSNVARVLHWLEHSAEGCELERWPERTCTEECSENPAVQSSVHSAVRAAVHDGLSTAPARAPGACPNVPPSHPAWRALDINAIFSGDCAWVDWAIQVMGLPIDRHFLDLAASCGNCFALDDVCFVSERPSINNLDYAGRAHCETGPTIAYRSGWALWHWHGVRVPQHVIEHPDRLIPSRIDKVRNAEVRRVMIERYGGFGRFIVHSGARLIHKDARGKLWRTQDVGREPIVIVEVRNSTPEPDGSRKTYFVRVPPGMQRASEAVAWTFGLTAQTYRPRKET